MLHVQTYIIYSFVGVPNLIFFFAVIMIMYTYIIKLYFANKVFNLLKDIASILEFSGDLSTGRGTGYCGG